MISNDVMRGLYEVVCGRKETFTEGSYTCYLFEKGLDKILKKCGEECSEIIIAAKNYEAAGRNASAEEGETLAAAKSDVENEICDLLYHLMVLMAQQGIDLEEINEILEERRHKIGNLKTIHESDHNS